MALTTHEEIRIEAGFQQIFNKESFLVNPTAGATVFHVRSDYNDKFVPQYATGNTVAGVSDVKVWMGASGIAGVSRMNVVALDADSGAVTLDTAPDAGCSLTISYASSQIPSVDVERVRLQAESIINNRLALCYDLPITPIPSSLRNLANRLSTALLLIRGYGVGSRDTSADGYALYELLMGSQVIARRSLKTEAEDVGEVGMICTPRYQLVDDNGVIIPRNDTASISGGGDFVDGGRLPGRVFDVTEEPWRFKEDQITANKDQPGSGIT